MLTSMVGVAALAVLLFALPLAVAVGRLYKGREVTRLEREATRAIGALPASGLRGTDPVEVPATVHGMSLAYYDTRGTLVIGAGPRAGGRDVTGALAGRVSEASGSTLSVAVPIHDEESVVGAARASESMSHVHALTYGTWAAMFGIALLALAAGALVARRQARRLAVPIGDIESLAVRLGDGDFAARIDPHDVPELARAANALNRTAVRLGDLIERERSFTADVSHQLSTPLTSLRLGLEGALLTEGIDREAAIADAAAEVQRLQATVITLLALARDAPIAPAACDAGSICAEVADRHRGDLAAAGRPLRLDVDASVPMARCAPDALREIIEVLVDNAKCHGRGAVKIRVRQMGPGIVVDVEDDGDGIRGDPEAIFDRRGPRATGHGIGLALARAVADAHGARLLLTRAAPNPVFSIMLARVTIDDDRRAVHSTDHPNDVQVATAANPAEVAPPQNHSRLR